MFCDIGLSNDSWIWQTSKSQAAKAKIYSRTTSNWKVSELQRKKLTVKSQCKLESGCSGKILRKWGLSWDPKDEENLVRNSTGRVVGWWREQRAGGKTWVMEQIDSERSCGWSKRGLGKNGGGTVRKTSTRLSRVSCEGPSKHFRH